MVILFASQWYIYDAVHHQAERVIYYLGTCAYLSGVLAPAVLWLGRRRPLDARSWKRNVPLHLAASVVLTTVGLLVETFFWWLPRTDWPFLAALRHCLLNHTQIALFTYWLLLGAYHVYAIYDRDRRRELHNAKLERELAQAHLTALRAQLQPHFLFNTLQAATMLIYQDPQGAEEILLSLSELLRISLHAMQEQEIPLHREMEFLRHYTAIQERRFGDRLRFTFQIEADLHGCAVPSLVLQPLVENAIHHGIQAHREADLVSVRARSDTGRLVLEVRNQTSALDDLPERLFSRGVGLANTRARLRQLYGAQQSFDIRNAAPSGVVVRLSMPLRAVAAVPHEFIMETVE